MHNQRENRSLMRIVKKNRFKNWVNFTRKTEAGVKASSPHTDVSRNLATVVVRGVLPGLRRRRTGLLPSGPKSSFHNRASFVFNLETKVLESGEAHSPSCLKSSVKFPQSVMIGVQCHLLVLVRCVFWKPMSLHRLPRYFGVLNAYFCWPAFKDADFIFQQDLAPAHTAKSTKRWLNDHGVGVFDWPANSPDLKPIEKLWGIVKRKIRNETKKRWAEGHCQEPGLPFHLSSATKLITSMPRQIEVVIKARSP